MGIMLTREDDKNVELTRRIAADLKAKMEAQSKQDEDEFVDNSWTF